MGIWAKLRGNHLISTSAGDPRGFELALADEAGGGDAPGRAPGQWRYDMPDLPAAIPDEGGGDLVRTVNVPDEFTSGRVTASIYLEHTATSDLTITLTSPTAVEVVLFDQGSGQAFGVAPGDADLNRMVFDDQGRRSVNQQQFLPKVGAYRPANPLLGFENEPAQGDWTLTITDNAGEDVGTLEAFTLIFEPDYRVGFDDPEQRIAVDHTMVASVPDEVVSDYIVLAPSYRLLRVDSDQPMRVRLYASEAGRDADVARAVGEPADATVGLVYEAVLAGPPAPPLDVAPNIVAHCPFGESSGGVPVNLTNMGAGGDCVLALWHVRIG